MAPNVKLTYFPGRGRAEAIRIMLRYGGVDFEDENVTFGQWPERKPSE